MSDKRPSSTKVRRECFDKHKFADELGKLWLKCHLCDVVFDPIRTRWEAEHTSPHAFGGDDIRPAHYECHKVKTATDLGTIAKAKRVRDKHFNIKRAKGFYKPKGMKFSWSQGRYVRPEADND